MSCLALNGDEFKKDLKRHKSNSIHITRAVKKILKSPIIQKNRLKGKAIANSHPHLFRSKFANSPEYRMFYEAYTKKYVLENLSSFFVSLEMYYDSKESFAAEICKVDFLIIFRWCKTREECNKFYDKVLNKSPFIKIDK